MLGWILHSNTHIHTLSLEGQRRDLFRSRSGESRIIFLVPSITASVGAGEAGSWQIQGSRSGSLVRDTGKIGRTEIA